MPGTKKGKSLPKNGKYEIEILQNEYSPDFTTAFLRLLADLSLLPSASFCKPCYPGPRRLWLHLD